MKRLVKVDGQIGGGNNWVKVIPWSNISQCCQNSSPLTMKIVNDPIKGFSKYIYKNNAVLTQECGFNELWTSKDFMDIFIYGHQINEDVNIYRIELSMEYNGTGIAQIDNNSYSQCDGETNPNNASSFESPNSTSDPTNEPTSGATSDPMQLGELLIQYIIVSIIVYYNHCDVGGVLCISKEKWEKG